MERRVTRRARRIRDILATLPDIEADLLAANADGKVLEKVIHKLEQKERALVERVEDLETKVSDLEFELSALQEDHYLIPTPRSLTEEMELEERLRL